MGTYKNNEKYKFVIILGRYTVYGILYRVLRVST